MKEAGALYDRAPAFILHRYANYVIDPEECMADNFKFAMYYGIDGESGQGYPNPEIIQGIIDILSQ